VSNDTSVLAFDCNGSHRPVPDTLRSAPAPHVPVAVVPAPLLAPAGFQLARGVGTGAAAAAALVRSAANQRLAALEGWVTVAVRVRRVCRRASRT
jgi:hypothetical protein